MQNIDRVLKETFDSIVMCKCHSSKSSADSCRKCGGRGLIKTIEDANISMIAAVGKNGVLGKNNKLLWHIPADFQYFRKNTQNKPIIMGRKTHESIGKILPDRKNIIITSKLDYVRSDAIIVNSIRDAILSCDFEKEIMVIGGGDIYEQFMPFVNKIYLTIIDVDVEGDTYFPDWESEWDIMGTECHDGSPSFSFNILERKRGNK